MTPEETAAFEKAGMVNWTPEVERLAYENLARQCGWREVHSRPAPLFIADKLRELAQLKTQQQTHGLPAVPPEGLLRSMATCLRHDFGIDKPEGEVFPGGMTHAQREAMLYEMRKLYDEVAGNGCRCRRGQRRRVSPWTSKRSNKRRRRPWPRRLP